MQIVSFFSPFSPSGQTTAIAAIGSALLNQGARVAVLELGSAQHAPRSSNLRAALNEARKQGQDEGKAMGGYAVTRVPYRVR